MPDIIKEGISVVLADGTTLRARRTWVAEDGRDLTLLTLEVDITEAPPATPEELLWFEPVESEEQLECRVLDSERRVAETQLTDGAPPASLDGLRGAAVLTDGHVVGILGQTSGTDVTPRIEPISQVPETLRPRQ
jgi:hypothetical protein